MKPDSRASNRLLGADSEEFLDPVLAKASQASVAGPLAEKPVVVGSKQRWLMRNQQTVTMTKERLSAATLVTAATTAAPPWTATARSNQERSQRTEAGECEA